MARITRLFFAMVCLCFLLALSEAARGGDGVDFSEAARSEAQAAANQPGKAWDLETLREMGRSLASLSDTAAAEVVWSVAKTSPQVDTSNFFSNALSSPSPVVRSIAASILIREISPVSWRLLNNMLTTERDSEVVWTVVQGFTHLPKNQAVSSLMNIMLANSIPEETLRDVGQELRRLTRTDISDDPGAWRDWWLDNEDFYKN